MYFFLCIWGDSRRKPFVFRSHTTHIAAIFVRGVQVPFSPSHFTTPPDRFAQYSKPIWDKALLLLPEFLQYTKILNYGRGGSFLGWVAPGSHSEPCPTVPRTYNWTDYYLNVMWRFFFFRKSKFDFSWTLLKKRWKKNDKKIINFSPMNFVSA